MSPFGGAIARAFYYPSIVWNASTNYILGQTWYNRINEDVILGALPMPFMTKDLLKENVKGIISLNEDYELKYLYNSESVWSEHGMKLLRLATPDLFAAPTIPHINKAIKFIEEIKSEKGSVYIHCKAGKTRSTTVLMCYLIHSENMNPDEAFRFIRSRRPQIWLRKPQLNCIKQFYELETKSRN